MIDNVTWLRGKHAFKARHRRAVHRRRPRARRAFPLHLPDDRRVPRGEERREPVRLHDPAAGRSATSTRQLQLRVLRLLRPGRLADQRRAEAAVRPALRPVRRARRRGRSRPTRIRTNFTIDKNNFAPRAGVSWSLDDQARTVAARVDRADVRAAAARLLRQRDPEQRRSDQLHGARSPATSAGAPAFPEQPRHRAARVRAAAAEHHRGRSGLPDAVGLAEQRAGRARAQQRRGGGGRLRELDRPQPAGADGRQPDPDRRRRWPTAGRSTRPRSARRRASIRRSTTSTCSSRSASRPTTRSPRR